MLRLHSHLPLRWTFFHQQCYYQNSISGLPTQLLLQFVLLQCQPACFSLTLSNLVATYTSELSLPIAQRQVSHRRPPCQDTESAVVGALISLGTLTSSLSLMEQHLSVNLLPSTTLKLLQVNYYGVSHLVECKIIFKNG